MSFSFKKALCALLLPAAFLTLASCGAKDTSYDTNNENGYTVSVRFDANGGQFTSSDTWVVSHCYNISEMPKNSDGMVDIPIVPPDKKVGAKDKDSDIYPQKEGYFLLGWYEKRVEHKDENGELYYTYEGRWDFDMENFGSSNYKATTLTVDPNKTYKSEEPVLTLYAAWSPYFTLNYYDISDPDNVQAIDKLDADKRFDPVVTQDIKLPYWEDGEANMNPGDIHVPAEKKGYAIKAVYTDGEDGKVLLTGDSFKHTGSVNTETGEVTGVLDMNVYVEFEKVYHIYTPKQFRDAILLNNGVIDGTYILCNDLDFEGTYWNDLLSTNTFNGTIKGNGYTIKNLSLACNNSAVGNYGLFGKLGNDASINNVKFDNIKLTISNWNNTVINYGLLTGYMGSCNIENVEITNSTLLIPYDVSFTAPHYSLGLISGFSEIEHGIDCSGITCEFTESGTPNYEIEISGENVLLNKIEGGNTVTPPEEESSAEESTEEVSSEISSDEAESSEESTVN